MTQGKKNNLKLDAFICAFLGLEICDSTTLVSLQEIADAYDLQNTVEKLNIINLKKND